ncbi:MAG: MBOAT family protein [Lachnospiraceae bacterium]|nr:MBOAT family protein [Lachnospiraceae bacterium]
MVFSSLIFITIFLPLCLGAYFVIPALLRLPDESTLKLKNVILLIFSLVFYAFGGVYYIALLLFVVLINFVGGHVIGNSGDSAGYRKAALVLTVSADILVLFFFKYFNLLIALIENMFFSGEGSFFTRLFMAEGNGALGFEKIVLPIGISFYIFQALSYVVDVYLGNAAVQKNFFRFALYISFFPQLIAGPIVKYKDIEEQIGCRTVNTDLFSDGVIRFCRGLGKKVIIANTLGEMVDSVWAVDVSTIGAATAWFTAICYSFQIYYDFSGYSDMAIGMGKMFGFEFKENFNIPYASSSVREFWRRWHISLSSWFRDYVYIPLGGSRKSKAATYRNIFIVFLLTGIWHGANQTFLIWGLVYGVLLILERAFLGKLLESSPLKYISRLTTFTVVTILWVIFRADDISLAFSFIASMFRSGSGDYGLLSFLSLKVIITFIFAFVFSGFFKLKKGSEKEETKAEYKVIDYVTALVLLVISTILLTNGTYNPFIYFQF